MKRRLQGLGDEVRGQKGMVKGEKRMEVDDSGKKGSRHTQGGRVYTTGLKIRFELSGNAYTLVPL